MKCSFKKIISKFNFLFKKKKIYDIHNSQFDPRIIKMFEKKKEFILEN